MGSAINGTSDGSTDANDTIVASRDVSSGDGKVEGGNDKDLPGVDDSTTNSSFDGPTEGTNDADC